MAKTLYNLCYDTKTIEDNGITPIQSILMRLGGWPIVEGSKWNEENYDWKTTLYNIQNEGFDIYNLLPVYVTTIKEHSSIRRIIVINQGTLPLGRETYLMGLENNIVKAYYDLIVELAVLLGANIDTALQEFKEVIDFEMEIAKIIVPNENMGQLNVRPTIIRQLQETFDNIKWVEYINNALKYEDNIQVTLDDIVFVRFPSYLHNLMQLLNRTSQRVLHNHLIRRVVTDSIPYLPDNFRKVTYRFTEIQSGVKATMTPRWMECINIVNNRMEVATKALYIRKYFSETAKQGVEQIVRDIRDTFNNTLNDIEWMDNETKDTALEKEIALKAHVAYSPQLLVDRYIQEYYVELHISSHNYLESILNLKRFLKDKVPTKLREVLDIDWPEDCKLMKVNGCYVPEANSIVLPVGILQGLFFNKDRPQYMNYGSIGFIIGHEIYHGFDDFGSQYDKNGQKVDWWGANTKKLFAEKTQCLIDQYSNFAFPNIKMHLNGTNTERENIADNGGLKIAYLAYEKWIGRNGEEPGLPGLNYTPKQLFWISMANMWCTKAKSEYFKKEITRDCHAPDNFRTIGSLQNSDHFAKDFNCPLDSYMNPRQKCKIW